MCFSKTKKVISSLILSVLLIFSIVPTAFAAEVIDEKNIPYEELMDAGYDKAEIENAAEMMNAYAQSLPEYKEKSGDSSDTVARLSVVTRVKGIGHAWIYVENLTDMPVQVGHYTLPANEGVSVGLFSFTCDDGIGIYYNVESYCCNVHGGDGLVSISTDLDAGELNKLSNKLLDYPNHWDPFFNCIYFAFSMWNSVSSKKVIPLVIPAFGQLQLRIHGGKENNLTMYCPRPDQVYRLEGKFGKEEVLVPVSAGSIDQPIGT